VHHSQTSTTFRDAYDLGIQHIDVFGISLDEVLNVNNQSELTTMAARRLQSRYIDRELFLRLFVAESDDGVRIVQKFESGTTLTDEARSEFRRPEIRARKHYNSKEKEGIEPLYSYPRWRTVARNRIRDGGVRRTMSLEMLQCGRRMLRTLVLKRDRQKSVEIPRLYRAFKHD